jgi:hypothetical protein
LLIDANLRRPILHVSGFQFFHSQSLVNCLAELRMHPQSRASVVSWLDQWRTCIPYLWLLPAGPVPLHPASLLSLPEMYVLIQGLLASQAIDLLILDCAALDAGADALALAVAVDATILVIEAGKEKKEGLNRASASLERFNAPILGVIINRWHSGLRSYFYAEHTPTELCPSFAQFQMPLPVTQMPLSNTPRLPAHTQELTSGKLPERAMPTETPPSLVRIAPSSLPLTTTEPSGKAIAYSVSQTRTLHMVPAKHKGIIIPARLYDLQESDQGQSVRSYDGSRHGQ